MHRSVRPLDIFLLYIKGLDLLFQLPFADMYTAACWTKDSTTKTSSNKIAKQMEKKLTSGL